MNTFHNIYSRFEQDFFGCIATGVLVSSIIGSIAAMYVLTHGNGPAQMTQLFFVVAACMCFNGSVLSQQKPKTIFTLLMVSICLNTLIAIFNIG